MIDAYAVSRGWERDGDWCVSPGTNWCAAGARVIIGEGARIGGGARIGEGAIIGRGASIGEGAIIGEGARIGEGASIGGCATGVLADLGREQGRGYARCAYYAADGSVHISAGCRDFPLAAAREHWGPGYQGSRRVGDEYLALCDYVEALHRIAQAEEIAK